MWRAIRLTLLLLALLLAGTSAVIDRLSTTDWDNTLTVGIFPIDADGREATRAYLATLSLAQFAAIEQFFDREARRHGVARREPVRIRLHPPLAEAPPRIAPDSSTLARITWSLRLRWYAWRHGWGRAGQIRMFVLYHDPAVTPRVPHSLGLQRGLVGVVYAFAAADATQPNNIVIAHELLHTLGATDKYHPATLQPLFPDGYAEPARQPRHPQPLAEIMAGRRALDASAAAMPDTLNETLVGPSTAREIGWPLSPAADSVENNH